jgi:hypothetical protein
MASTSRSSSLTGAQARTLQEAVTILDTAAGETETVDVRVLQDALAAVTRVYAARVEAGGPVPALSVGGAAALPTATEVLVTVSGLLESAHIEPFELGLWQASRGGHDGEHGRA